VAAHTAAPPWRGQAAALTLSEACTAAGRAADAQAMPPLPSQRRPSAPAAPGGAGLVAAAKQAIAGIAFSQPSPAVCRALAMPQLAVSVALLVPQAT
jgi:hypothetical protein